MKNEKLVKAFALILLVGVLSSLFVISSSADSYQSIAPITFSNFEGVYSAVAFPGAASLPLASNGTAHRTYLNYSDYSEHSARILYDTYYDTLKVPYIQISLSCNYSSVYLGSVLYSGSHSASTITDTFSGLTSFECYSAENSYTPNVTYFYTWNIILGNFINYDDVYNEAFSNGVNSSQAKDKWWQEGYDEGLDHGINSSASSLFAQNIIGDTLSAPLRALNQFTLFTSPSGVNVSLGMVFGSLIGFILFLAFLKMFAGG